MDLSECFLDHFSDIKDPRRDNENRKHELMDILVITILATICGAEGWNEIADFGSCKADWLRTFLSLPNGIPSHDTFGRVFSLIDPKEFDKGFSSWIESLSIDINNEIISIDGKSLRGSKGGGETGLPTHLVSAWSSKHQLLLAQIKTLEKSNEIEAIPRLLKMIEVQDSIVTIDAMGCQRKIAKQIISQGADYILTLKNNQMSLYNDVKSIINRATMGEKKFKKMLHLCRVEKIKSHGRIERRRYTLISARDPLFFHLRWPGLASIGILETKRTVNHKTEHSIRFFLSTLDYERIDDFMRGVRKHWDIEINLHWSLDVSFREDYSRVRAGNASENLATVRRIALNLLKQDNTMSAGITRKRKRAGWENAYLLTSLNTKLGDKNK